MKKDLNAEIMEVLNQYSICYSDKGILDNLECYSRNKRGLISLLKKHPRWNENAMAVILEVTVSREIDKNVITECMNTLYTLASNSHSISGNDVDSFWYGLRKLLHFPNKLLQENEETRRELEQTCGFSYIAGQKTSKAVNKFCRQYKLNEHSEYDAVFAKLADALNPLSIPRKAVLSVHPCDFLQMSGINNSWSSCHRLSTGDYSGGTLSYMNDPISMIFYTVDPGNEDIALHDRPKISRTVFCYQGGILLQSRLYPNDSDRNERNLNRRCVQSVFAECLKKPNLWKLDRSEKEMGKYIHTIKGHLHFADYTAGYNWDLSFLKANSTYLSMVIGHNGYCVHCGRPLCHDDRQVVCRECARLVRCYECGSVIEKSFGTQIDNRWYCQCCIDVCDQCGEKVAKKSLHPVHPSLSEEMRVCGSCRGHDYFQCAGCGEYHSTADQYKHDGGLYCSGCSSQFEAQESTQGDNVVQMPEVLRRAS